MNAEFIDKNDEPKVNRKLFKRRKKATEIMTIFNRRFINNLRKNWEIKQNDHLLPKAGTIFDFIDDNLSEMRILKEKKSIGKWWEIVKDEEFVEKNIQENIAILSWVYWQRLEGYEILDVSLSRERLVEDIGCIQQFYNAADGLILEYQNCFTLPLPIDIMCVCGLYEYFHTNFHHFIMVPNQTRYEYIPAWVSVAHEVAHIMIEEVENNYYSKWQKVETAKNENKWIEKRDYIKENEFRSEFANMGSKIELFLGILEDLEDVINEIKQENVDEKYFDPLSKKLTKLRDKLKVSYKNKQDRFICNSLLEDIELIKNTMVDMVLILHQILAEKEHDKSEIKKISQVKFKLNILEENVLRETLFSSFPGDTDEEKIDEFFSNWKKIKKRAIDVAEIIMHVLEGDSGYMYLDEQMPVQMNHVQTSQHILADIIATFLAGEYYIYSLIFYRFLPSVIMSKEEIMIRKQRVPMSLRLLICLETLKYSSWRDSNDELKKIIEDVEDFWEELILKCSKNKSKEEKLDKKTEMEQEFDNFGKEIKNDTLKMTATLIWNLIMLITEEDFSLEEEYIRLLERAKNGKDEIKGKFDKSYFTYMRHALGYTLRRTLRNAGVLVGTDSSAPLQELICLVGTTLIDSKKVFTSEERYEKIGIIRKKLTGGELALDMGQDNARGSIEYYTPRNILSAYSQIYFENILNPKANEKSDYIKAFNSTVMSMAWTQYSLKRFHEGAI